MENQDFKEGLAERSARIRRALERGPLVRQQGLVAPEGPVEPLVEAKESVPATFLRRAFISVKSSLAGIKALMGETPALTPSVDVVLTQEGSEEEEAVVSERSVDEPADLSPVEALRRAQKANVAANAQRRAAEPSATVLPSPATTSAAPAATPSVSTGPSLRDLLLRMGSKEFSRVVQDTLSFDRARVGAGSGFDFVAADARTNPSEAPSKPSSYQDQAALRAIVRENVVFRGGFDKTEEMLKNTLYLEEKTARRAREGQAKSVGEKIEHIHGLERRLVDAVIKDPDLLFKAALQNENRWSPRAHLLAARKGLEPTPAMTKLADIYNRFVGFLQSTTTRKPEPVEPPPTIVASTSADVAPKGAITGENGVYHHHRLEIP